MTNVQILSTERLYLREIVDTDDVGMFELDSDPEVHRFIFNDPVKHIDQCREIIQYIRQQYRDNGIGRWALLLKGTNEFIGWAGIKIEHDMNGHTSFHDLGFRIMTKHWNKGYSTEISKALLDYGFNVLKIDTICGVVFTKHLASRRVFEKCGFRECNSFYADGDDNIWYEYHRKDYPVREG